jgi:hypothetical protein
MAGLSVSPAIDAVQCAKTVWVSLLSYERALIGCDSVKRALGKIGVIDSTAPMRCTLCFLSSYVYSLSTRASDTASSRDKGCATSQRPRPPSVRASARLPLVVALVLGCIVGQEHSPDVSRGPIGATFMLLYFCVFANCMMSCFGVCESGCDFCVPFLPKP